MRPRTTSALDVSKIQAMGTASSTQSQGHGGATGGTSTGPILSGLQSLSHGLSIVSKTDKYIQKKMESALKTGVLNLSDLVMLFV